MRLDHGVRCGVMESGFREVGSRGKVWGYGVRVS